MQRFVCSVNSKLFHHPLHLRTVTTSTGFVGGKIIFISALAIGYFLFQSLLRTKKKQMRSIKCKFLEQERFGFFLPYMKRPKEEKELNDLFSIIPSRPIVIVGNEGAGKGWTLKSILQHRPMTILLDLRREPSFGNNEFVFHFLKSVGYIMPSNDYLMRWLLRIKNPEKQPRIERPEIDLAFTALESFLLAEKKNGWKNGIPLIAINEIESAHVTPTEEFSKFMNFCVWICDNRLAHFVIATTRDFNTNILDQYYQFKMRRDIYYFDQPDPDNVKNYISENQVLSNVNVKLTPNDLNQIISVVGTSMTSIGTVLNLLRNGVNLEEILFKLVSEGVRSIRSILEEFTSSSDKYKTYVRFWKMMTVLVERDSVRRQELVNLLFFDHYKELDDYERSGFIVYRVMCSKEPEIIHESKNADNFFGSYKETITVSTTSPIIKLAFKMILNDPAMIEQYQKICKELDEKKYEKEIEKLKLKINIELERQSRLSQELDTLLKHSDKYKETKGDLWWNATFQDYINYTSTTNTELSTLYIQLKELQNKIDN